jgi:hypothetical protein
MKPSLWESTNNALQFRKVAVAPLLSQTLELSDEEALVVNAGTRKPAG